MTANHDQLYHDLYVCRDEGGFAGVWLSSGAYFRGGITDLSDERVTVGSVTIAMDEIIAWKMTP